MLFDAIQQPRSAQIANRDEWPTRSKLLEYEHELVEDMCLVHGVSTAVVLHALYVCCGNVEAACMYLRDSAAGLSSCAWSEEDDLELQSLTGTSTSSRLVAKFGDSGIKARRHFLTPN